MRILFVSSTRIGDAVITTGILDHLIRQHPQARVTVVCGPAAAGVYSRLPGLERIVLLEKMTYDRHWLLLWRRVVGTRWDLVVDLRGSGLSYLLRAKRRVISRRLPGRKFQQLGALLGLDPAPLPVVFTAAEDEAKAAALLPAGRPVIALGPTANWAPKVWAPERFAALYHQLAAGPLPAAAAVVLGGPGEAERKLAEPLLALLPDAIDLCGKLSLPETAAVIRRSRIFIGNDSGLMHLAAATGIPTVGLCGTTIDRAEEMVPAGLHADWALASSQSMEALPVATALAVAERLLKEAEAG